MPNLDDLLKWVEQANSHPIMANDYLKRLSEDIQIVIQKVEHLEQFFATDKT